MEILLIIILGWPGVIVGYFLLCISIIFENKKLGIAGAILATGFCLYAYLYPPPTRWIALTALVCNFLSLFRSGKQSRYWRVSFLLPLTVLIIWIAYAVLSQE